MKHVNGGWAGALIVLTAFSSASWAQGKPDLGKSEYLASCANCHGSAGKGNGPMREHLTKAPTDLTILAKQNGGVFPSQRITELIDGRTSVMIGSHGAREMPIWGHIYRGEDTQPRDLHARNRIASLVDYLARIQEK